MLDSRKLCYSHGKSVFIVISSVGHSRIESLFVKELGNTVSRSHLVSCNQLPTRVSYVSYQVSMFFVIFLHNLRISLSFKLVALLPFATPQPYKHDGISLSFPTLVYGVWYLATFSIWFWKRLWFHYIFANLNFSKYGNSWFSQNFGFRKVWAYISLGFFMPSINPLPPHILLFRVSTESVACLIMGFYHQCRQSSLGHLVFQCCHLLVYLQVL